MNRPVAGGGIAIIALILLLTSILRAGAVAPANEHFQRTWARTDQPVVSGQIGRTWMWGPEGFTGELQEPYSNSPGGQRSVQYFDKARMEITNPNGDSNSIWYVTNGLLVVELITGRLQSGDAGFQQRSPAVVNVAGDGDDPTGPTYATFGTLLDSPALPFNQAITQRVDRAGNVSTDASLAGYGIGIALVDDVTKHAIATPFWEFMTSSGTVWDGTAYVTAPLFENAYFATGRPITEAYWANVKVAGTYQDVLMQCFERRCLTYNPANAPEWRVEAGNVGRHYHAWRYAQPPEPTPTPTGEPEPTATEPEEPATRYAFDFAFGQPYSPTLRLRTARGIGLDNSGNIWVADSFNDRVIGFDRDGRYLWSFGTHGAAAGQFDFPTDVAFDSQNLAYVMDVNNRRVQKLTRNGDPVKSWGTAGSLAGQFSLAYCIAVHQDIIYVCDTGNHRIQRFNTNGDYLGQWGTFGTGPGQFDSPHGIAFDADGNSYVVDYENDRVQKFNAAFAYVGEFGDDEGPGALQAPEGVALDADGNVYVTSLEGRVVVFEPDGDFLEEFGEQGNSLGDIYNPVDLTIDAGGNAYVLEYRPRLQKFAPDHTPLWGLTDATRFRFEAPIDIAVTTTGELAITDDIGFGRVAYYSLDGKPGLDIYYEDVANMPPDYASAGVAVAPDGTVYVSDAYNGNIWYFTADRRVISHWGSPGSAPGEFAIPLGIAVDDAGDVYVVDALNNRIQKFNPTGTLLDVWGEGGSGDGQFFGPIDIAVHGERVYVTDANNQRVQVFDLDGNFVGKWGAPGVGPGEFDGPYGIAVDGGGYVYVVDQGNNRIQKFTPEGEHMATFGLGGQDGLDEPWGLAVAPDGRVYVADTENQRVVVFRPDD